MYFLLPSTNRRFASVVIKWLHFYLGLLLNISTSHLYIKVHNLHGTRLRIWEKGEKRGPWAKNLGERVTPPFPPSPGQRSARDIFFYLTPFFAFLPYCGAWSHATFMLPIVITLCLFSSICIIGHFRVSTAHFFLKLPKRNGANHFIFRPESPVFPCQC